MPLFSVHHIPALYHNLGNRKYKEPYGEKNSNENNKSMHEGKPLDHLNGYT